MVAGSVCQICATVTFGDIDKGILLRDLIIELDGSVDEGVEQAWLEEAHRRLKERESTVT